MFGQAPSTSPFGAPSPAAPFGAPAPAAPFGGFGQPPAPATGGFGVAAPATGGFGTTSAFGQPAAAPTLFGAPTTTATGAFGQPANATPAFGSPPAMTGGFGAAPASSVFGAPAPATGGLFGSAAPAPSLFGSAAAAPAFGAKPAGGGLFGSAPAPSVGLFGSAPAPASRGLFGAAPSPPPFGSPAPASFFGAPAPAPTAFGAPAPAFGAATGAFGAAPATGGFGQPQQLQQAQTGSMVAQYQSTTKQDGTSSIILQAITAMPQYEQKSFEELRLEDYMAGNKGTKSQATPGTSSGFGGFGVAPAPAFGQPASAPAFGAAPAAAGGLFGSSPAPAPGLFFGAPTPAPAFGQPAPAPAFGATPAPATGGLFGSAPAPAPTGGLFGAAPAPAFGQPAPAPAFGSSPAPATGGFFGSTPAPAFGASPQPAPSLFGAAPAPATGGLFGAPAPAPTAGGLFGSTPAPAPGGLFGQPAPAPSLFQPAPAPGGLFGAPSPAKPGGLFGAAPAPSSVGLFGQTQAPSTSGLFGQAPAPAPSTGGLFGHTPSVSAVPVAPPPSADALLAQQLAAVENQKKQLELLEAWRGNPPSGSRVVPTSQYYADSGISWNGGGSSYALSSSPLHSYRAAAKSTAKIRPRGYTPTKESPATMLGMKSGSPILSPNKFVGSTTKTLFIKPSALTPKPKNRLLLPSDLFNASPGTTLENGNYEVNRTPTNGSTAKLMNSVSSHQTSQTANSPLSPAHDFYLQVVDSTTNPPPSSMLQPGNKFVPKLSKPGYVVYPSISELEPMSEADLAAVTGFMVERPNYGSVAWDGAVDVRGVDIDSVVVIESKNVSVYDESELKGEKPQRGSKLNRPAVITMYNVFPKEGAESSAEAKEKMTRKIEKSTKKMGAELISYDPDNGVWKFRVGHFSRYGLDDDDDDSDDESEMDVIAPATLETPNDEKENIGVTYNAKELGGASRIHAPIDEDESTSINTDVISDVETFDPVESEDDEYHEVSDIVRAGEEAYAMMTREVLAEYEDDEFMEEPTIDEEKLPFPVEGEGIHVFPASQVLKVSGPISSTGISRKLAEKCGLKIASNIDYGMRMRQSFRVGWRPDGSFYRLTRSGILAKSRPAIVALSSANVVTSLPLLHTHKKHCVKAMREHEAPIFTLPRNEIEDRSEPLLHAMEDYFQSSSLCLFGSATKKAVSNAFSLLISLYGREKSPDSSLNDSFRLEAVSTWLKRVVASDMMHAISITQKNGDVHGSVFAALSGGDTERASSLALMGGCPGLSLMVSNSGVQAQPFCANQLEMWHNTEAQQFTPTSLLRIISLASGSIDIERQMYKVDSVSYDIDWRRRFGMYLWSCSHSKNQTTVSSAVNQYSSDISDGFAPPGIPLYCVGSRPTNKCIFYQILSHHGENNVSLANIIDPMSHTPFANDFSASFHLCATMSALTESKLSCYQEEIVIESLASQLIGDGLWEWAVYVSLCSIGGTFLSRSTSAARMIRAKNIVMRFYSPSTDPLAESRRLFLQDIGVPLHWLAQAHAYRCASEGDVFGMFDNLFLCSASESMILMERLIIPHMIIEGKHLRTQLWQLLESLRSQITEESIVRWNKLNGCGMFHQFLDLQAKVETLIQMQSEKLQSSDVNIDNLLEIATDLEAMISEGSETGCDDAALPLIKVVYNFRRTPLNVVKAEVRSCLSLLRMKLLARKTGKPFTFKSQMALTCPSHLSSLKPDGLYADSIIRGLCGFEPIS